MNRSEETVKLYERYLEKHPNDACAKLDLGIHYLARNDLENSIKLLTSASQDPLYAFDALSNLAAAYVRLGQPREAIDCWTRVVSMDESPEKQVFWQDVASSHEKGGDIEKAKEAWGRFLDYFPDSLPAARHLAELCRTSGDNAALSSLELRLRALSPPIVINKSLTRELDVAGISGQDAFEGGIAIDVYFSILKNIPRDRELNVRFMLVREGTSGPPVEREAIVEPSRMGPGPFWRGDSLRQKFAFSVPRDLPPGEYRIEMTAGPDGASRVSLGTFSVPATASTAASPEADTVTSKEGPAQ
jgi:tetratricopeptide (TPR) repeat protein